MSRSRPAAYQSTPSQTTAQIISLLSAPLSKHDKFTGNWFNVGQASQTMGQHWVEVSCLLGYLFLPRLKILFKTIFMLWLFSSKETLYAFHHLSLLVIFIVYLCMSKQQSCLYSKEFHPHLVVNRVDEDDNLYRRT